MIIFSNPSAQTYTYKSEIKKKIDKFLNSKQYINGAEVADIEKRFAKFIGSKYGIGVANGTDALELSLRSLNISSGDEVITTTHTAVATVAAIIASGAKPVLADIDPDSYTINVDQFRELLSSRTRAVIPVHIYGNSANIHETIHFCKKNNLFVIEDVSQAHGAKKDGMRLGNYGHLSCYSCYPTKNLGALGDAGLITTNDNKLDKKIRMLREYGWKKKYISETNGRNSRLDELQAAILNVKLKYLDRDNNKRIKIANIYNKELKDIDIITPKTEKGVKHVYHLYVIRTKKRNKLRNYLAKNNIITGIHYPIPIHLQPAYKSKIKVAKNMSISENFASEILSLPIYPELSLNDVYFTCNKIKKFFR